MFLSPRWIASHVFVAVLIVAFIAAGFWQINRLNQRLDENELVRTRLSDVVLLESVVNEPADELEFRRVQVSGNFNTGSEILIANRSREGEPGFWVWTTFETSVGDILVNRGFVNREIVLGTVALAIGEDLAATRGQITIEGLIREGFDRGNLSEAGDQISIPNPTLAAETLGLDLALDPVLYLQLEGQSPIREQTWPQVVPPPGLGEGPHRSYAFQWFTFATIGIIGYGLVLRRINRGDQARGDVPAWDHVVEGSVVEGSVADGDVIDDRAVEV